MAREYELNYRERMIVWVWERMQAAHGERFEKVFGQVWDAKRERERKKRPHLWPRLSRVASIWADKLQGFDREAIAEAVHLFEERPELPTLPEFLSACAGKAGDGAQRKPPPRIETPEDKAHRLQAGMAKLKRLRGVLGE